MLTFGRVFVAVIAGIIIILNVPAYAYGNVSIKVTPLKFVYEVSPGEKVQGTVRVGNGSNQKQKIKIFAERVRPKSTEEGRVTFIPAGGGAPGRDFEVQPETGWVELAPGEFKEIPFEVHIPENIEPGEIYKGLSIESYPDGDNLENQIIVGKVTVPIIAQIKGNVIDTGKVLEFKAKDDPFNKLPLDFTLVFENTGNVSYPLNGVIFVRHKGLVLAALKFEDKTVFSGQKGTATVTWEKYDNGNLPEGEYQIFGKVNYGIKAQLSEDFKTTARFSPYQSKTPPETEGMDNILMIIRVLGYAFLIIVVILLLAKWYSNKKKDFEM